METLGSRIRDLRERRGLDAREFARRVGMAYSTLMDLENGHSKSTRRLHAIIEELGTTAEYLEHGRGGPGTDVLGASTPSQAPAQSRPVRSGDEDFIAELLEGASPRTRDVLLRLAESARTGRLTDADVELLGQIGRRLEGTGTGTKS